MDEIAKAQRTLASLTEKQRDVLNLLVQHKSSKEIARTLGISPYTVDQRIGAARRKFGVSRRGEVARTYGQLCGLCDESAYQIPYIANLDFEDESDVQAKDMEPTFTFSDTVALQHSAPWEVSSDPASGLEAYDNRFGKSGRALAILILAAVLALTLLAMVSMAKTLSEFV